MAQRGQTGWPREWCPETLQTLKTRVLLPIPSSLLCPLKKVSHPTGKVAEVRERPQLLTAMGHPGRGLSFRKIPTWSPLASSAGRPHAFRQSPVLGCPEETSPWMSQVTEAPGCSSVAQLSELNLRGCIFMPAPRGSGGAGRKGPNKCFAFLAA